MRLTPSSPRRIMYACTLRRGVLFVFCKILDIVKLHIVKTTITIISQTIYIINVFVLTVIWVSSCVWTSCKMILCLCTAAERAHRVTPQASWLPSGPPREEEEEGEPWGARAIAQSPKDDRPQSQTLPQAETRWEDPDEEDVSVTYSFSLVTV